MGAALSHSLTTKLKKGVMHAFKKERKKESEVKMCRLDNLSWFTVFSLQTFGVLRDRGGIQNNF